MPRSRWVHAAAVLLAGAAVLAVVCGCARPAALAPVTSSPVAQPSPSVSAVTTYSAGELLVALSVPRVIKSDVAAPFSLTLTNRSNAVSVVHPALWLIQMRGITYRVAGSFNPPAWRDRRKAAVSLAPQESLEVTYSVRLTGPAIYRIAPGADTSRERRGLVSTPVTVTVE